MRGLTIVLAEPLPARMRAALTMVLAVRALGGRARLFLDVDAVAAATRFRPEPLHLAAGLPETPDLLDDALEAGVEVMLCQTGLALAGLSAAELDPRLAYGGVTSLLATIGDDRLIAM